MCVSSVIIYPEPHMIPTIKFNDYLLNYLSENINKTADNEGLSKKVL